MFEVLADPVAMPRPRVTVIGGHPHAYTPTKAVEAQRRIEIEAYRTLGGEPRFEGPLAVSVVVWLRPPKSMPKKHLGRTWPTTRPDADNYLKLALDACACLWLDDAQVVRAQVTKRYDWGGIAHWAIVVEELDG
jgi:Holliday junction resolvase RusA-like endonuclease